MGRSFKEYVEKHFYDKLFECVSGCISEHTDDISKKMRRLHRMGEISLYDIDTTRC